MCVKMDFRPLILVCSELHFYVRIVKSAIGPWNKKHRSLRARHDSCLHRFCDVFDVLVDEAAHGHASALRDEEYAVVLAHVVHLCLAESSEGEHADACADVVPVAGALYSAECLEELLAHVVDAVCHGFYIAQELLFQPSVAANYLHEVGAVDRAHGPCGAHDRHQCGLHCQRLGSAAVVHHVTGAHALAIKAEVLGEALSHQALNTLAREEARREPVLFERAAGEALVGDVEEGDEVPALENLEQLQPLPLRKVNSRGVVGTRMHQEHRALGRSLYVLQALRKIN